MLSAAPSATSAVLVHGEAGIGKSRLVAELTAWCDRQSIATSTAHAYQAEGRLPYAPLAEVLRSPAVRATVTRLAGARLFTALGEAFAAVNRPFVVVVEDLQWCDAQTLEFVHFLVRSSAGRPLLVVGTVRDEEVPDDHALATTIAGLRRLDAVVDIGLQRLAPTVAGEVVRQVLGDGAHVDAVERIVAQAGGNPLFLVEMSRAGLTASEPVAALPRKVQDVIDARLSRVSAAGRRLAEVGAVIGRPFDLDLVGRIAGTPADELVPALDEVWHHGLVVETGTDSYDFSHDRIRDVAYERIGPATRRQLHRAVADALAELGDDRDAASIAVHYERAGAVLPALDHFQRAVDAARRVFAHDEMIALAQRSLELLDRVAAGPDRARREIALLGALAVAVHAGPGVTPARVAIFEHIDTLRGDVDLVIDPPCFACGRTQRSSAAPSPTPTASGSSCSTGGAGPATACC